MTTRLIHTATHFFGYIFLVAVCIPSAYAAERVKQLPITPPTSLENCLELAVQYNPELRQAYAGFQNAEGQAVGLRAILYPTLRTQAISTPPIINVQLEQVLYDHAVGPRLQLARLVKQEAVIQYQFSLNRVFFQIQQTYATALAHQAAADLVTDYINFYIQMKDRSTQLFEAGKLKKAELSRLDVKINQAQEQLQSARLAYQQNLLELNRLVGRELPEHTRLSGHLGAEIVPELNTEKLIQDALLKRQDYQYLKLQTKKEAQAVELATHPLYPRLAIGSNSVFQPISFGSDYDFARNDNEPATQRSSGNTQIPLSVYLTWNFFDGNRSQGVKQSAQANLVSQQEALKALENAIPGEIIRIVSKLQATKKNLVLLLAAPQAEQLRTVAKLDFESGRMSLLNKADLEDTILFQEQTILEQRLNLTLSSIALDFSLGRSVYYTFK